MPKIPQYPENESSFELEEMIHPITRRKDPPPFHTRLKPDYGPLKKLLSRDKLKKK